MTEFTMKLLDTLGDADDQYTDSCVEMTKETYVYCASEASISPAD